MAAGSLLRDDPLSLWTVYERPKDYPTGYVARRFVITPTGSAPTTDVLVADTLDELRAQLPEWLVRMERHPGDEPQIVEVWI